MLMRELGADSKFRMNERHSLRVVKEMKGFKRNDFSVVLVKSCFLDLLSSTEDERIKAGRMRVREASLKYH
jgi:hypothetical protein